jgi:hypothetical protein
MRKRSGRRVEIEWEDASLIRGWAGRGDREDESLMRCFTMGYLLKGDRRTVRVVMSCSEVGSVAECLVIPRSTIRRIRRL